MNAQTYARGIVLWVDDRFEDVRSDGGTKGELWQEVFGNTSDRLFRLMDLSLEIACSREEAFEAIRNATSPGAAGAYVFCILDLNIPERSGMQPAMRHGIDVAKELQRRRVRFEFLSANANAATVLSRANLEKIPYHVKEQAAGIWRLPESLAQSMLGRFRRNISWVSLADVVANMHKDSDIVRTQAKFPQAFEYFPFFGPYEDFVHRWEHEGRLDLPGAFVVRSAEEHCHKFVQQALSLMLYDRFARRPGEVRVRYGDAHDPSYCRPSSLPGAEEDGNAVSIVRVSPEHTTVPEFRALLSNTGRLTGTVVFVLPNTEVADQYTQLVRAVHVPVVDDIPQTQVGDSAGRQELIARTCALVFQQWSLAPKENEAVPLPMGYLAHPELLINPIEWIAIQEAADVAIELSDPYEITKELFKATEIEDQHREELREAVTRRVPVPYHRLLRVGGETLRKSEVIAKLPEWMEEALDSWLSMSWRFPFGLRKQFAQAEEFRQRNESWCQESWKAWEDSCFEVLVGMLEEYVETRGTQEPSTDRQKDLLRVKQFVDAVKGTRFLAGTASDVDWEALEGFRWPHHRYPMPAAINRRLRDAKKYLWIQPEGLDTALGLPWGRLRYRFLAEIVDRYSSVLDWAQSISPKLPLGWRSSVEHLVRVIQSRRIREIWEDPTATWQALLGIAWNGVPTMFIADRILRGSRDGLKLAGMRAKESAEKTLKESRGVGTLLGKLRSPDAARLTGCLVNKWIPAAVERYEQLLRDSICLLESAGLEQQDDVRIHTLGLARSVAALLGSLNGTSQGGSGEQSDLASVYAAFLSNTNPDGLNPIGKWADKPSDETVAACPTAMLQSLFKTRGDYSWCVMELHSILTNLSYPYRFFDGYYLINAINDLRVRYKGNPYPKVDFPIAETLLDLFLASIEGLVAQLAFCLKAVGQTERAEEIVPKNVVIQLPQEFSPPAIEDLNKLLQVVETPDGYAVCMLGSPSGDAQRKLTYHEGGLPRPLSELTQSGES